MEKYYNKKMKLKKIKEKGFTLIELLAVVLIITILTAIAVPQYNKAVNKARLSEALLVAKFLERSMDSLLFSNKQGSGRALIGDFGLSGAAWDETGLKYLTKIHSIDISCESEQCIAHIVYPKEGSAKYILTYQAIKDTPLSKTCQGLNYICSSIEDKGYTSI